MIIKFSHHYCKMPPGFDESELMEVFKVPVGELSGHFVNWDTKARSGFHYILPRSGYMLVLLLRTRSTGLMWTTLRRSIDFKEAYYRSRIGEYFDCVVTEVE